jgi:sRNA-binding carbon storage regulator CsrA
MLVLSRKKGDSVVIASFREEGESLVITLVTVVDLHPPDQVTLQVDGSPPFNLRKNDNFVISPNSTVTLVDMWGDKVRLGFVVPRDLVVHRKEVFDELYGEAQ